MRPWLLFIAAFLLLHGGYVLLRADAGGWIDALTVPPAALFIGLFAAEPVPQADGHRLVWPQGSLGLRNGCDGLEVMVLFAAAALAGPWRWALRLVLAVAGVLLLWALNQGRIAVLYAAFRHQREWFDGLHTVWLPLALVLAAAAAYAWALARLPRPQ